MLHAARLLEVDTGNVLRPGEILVEGERIKAVGTAVDHPQGAKLIDLGDATLMPGMIDAHVHLFLHPGAEDLQTVEESVPWRTILAEQAAKADLMAGFTAERDMGTEGAGSADTAIRDAINQGLIPGPRLRISGNAIDILGGHEDANQFNPAQHVLSNADYANSAEQDCGGDARAAQRGLGLCEDLRDRAGRDGGRSAACAVSIHRGATSRGCRRGAQAGDVCGVHAMGEPGTLYAAQAGVGTIDHATQLSDETMRLMREKGIFAVPTFTIFDYFAHHRESQDQAATESAMLDYKIAEFKKQIAAGVPFAVGSDVGPFPHGTQAHELTLMVRYGMKPLAALQADMINGAKVLGWAGQIGELKPGYYADIIAVPGNPLDDISAMEHVSFVMKNGEVVRQ